MAFKTTDQGSFKALGLNLSRSEAYNLDARAMRGLGPRQVLRLRHGVSSCSHSEASKPQNPNSLEFKCIHDAFHKCFHQETFRGEASSALGPHLNHKRSRMILGLNRNVQGITTIKKQCHRGSPWNKKMPILRKQVWQAGWSFPGSHPVVTRIPLTAPVPDFSINQ